MLIDRLEARLSGGQRADDAGSAGRGAEAVSALEGEEAALLADTMAGGEAGPPMTALAGADPREHASADAAPPVPGPADSGPAALPGLDELVARIPDPVREALDELFRARFIAVRRYPAQPTEA